MTVRISLNRGMRSMEDVQKFVVPLIENVERVIVGKRLTIEFIIVALLCEGHVLLEDVPGSGKTMLARSIATSLGINFKRIQCTPDLLPNDVTGVSVFNQKSGEFEFKPGPIFVNILLADEINRATPRTQAALLEAMQEQQVTVDGVTRDLPRPFLVLATQNPIEYEGTFPLPEAQLDRFLMRLSMGYPSRMDERQILTNLWREHPITKIGKVIDGHELLFLQKRIWDVNVDATLQDYIVALAESTRNHSDLSLGVSPRGTLALLKAAQAFAAIRGRDYVIPEDVRTLVPLTLAHRLILKPEAELRGRTGLSILEDVLDKTPLDLGTANS
jgi:MoxR-like ATPase